MALTADSIVDNLVSTYDVTQPRALQILNQRYDRMVAESGFQAREDPITTTVANQNAYTLDSDIIQLRYVETRAAGSTTGGFRYDLSSMDDIRDIEGGRKQFYANGLTGLVAIHHTATGGDELYLYPAPSTTGQSIVAVQTFVPADLTYGTSLPTVIPVQFREALQDGCHAECSKQIVGRFDMAQGFEQSFQAGVVALQRYEKSRQRPSGPFRITVSR